jgi:hypothetical protein
VKTLTTTTTNRAGEASSRSQTITVTPGTSD